MNSRFFNLYCDYYNSLTVSNANELLRSRIPNNHIHVQKEKEDFVVPCLRPPENTILRAVYVIPERLSGRVSYQNEICTKTAYRAFSLTWPASMQIYDTKRNCLHKKRVQLPQDYFGTPTWPPFIVLENQYGRRYVSLRRRRLERTGTGKNGARESSRPPFFLAPITSKRQATVT